MPCLVGISPVVLRNNILKFLSMYFHYFVIISPNKKAWPFILRNFNILYQRMLYARFGRNLSSGFWIFLKSLQTDGRRTGLYVTRVSETRHRFFDRSAHLCISTGPIIEWIKIKFDRWKLQDNNNNQCALYWKMSSKLYIIPTLPLLFSCPSQSETPSWTLF